ncbi:unnamed protein product [Brassicogethes aeneus]|uniref:Fanconi anemia group D2 protein n=1 Tax=Brassicogethes aeneus TaxID=1431903 RepID=A0A9P0AXB9_BRAAE|nr:unnamed protein product [Brassicogethes aeneus]
MYNRDDTAKELSYFQETLKETGVTVSFDEESTYLNQEQAIVVRDLENLLKYPNSNQQQFVRELKIFFKDEEYLRKSFVPTILKKPDSQDTLQNHQESLIRLLLKVNSLQKEVINVILEEITKDATEEHEDTSWLRLLINSLRYLPYINEPRNLTVKLLDILEISGLASQLEILDSIPDIIPDSQYYETAEQLGKLLDLGDDNLSGAIIDCLNALNLDSTIRAQVQDKILSNIIAGPSLKIFPVLLEFLMADTKIQNNFQTFIKIRNSLDTLMMSVDSEKDSNKIVIFSKLQMYCRTSKIISEAWINTISGIKNPADHKPVDLLILFMLHATSKLKNKSIETLMRKKVTTGFFKINHLDRLFDEFMPQQLLKEYFTTMVEIGCNLLRLTQVPEVVEFAMALFKILFAHSYTEIVYRKELLDNLILLTGFTKSDTVEIVLKLLSEFLNDFKKMQQHTVLLMLLLEKLDTFELKDVKQVFEILCTLTCGEKAEECMSGLKDEIHILVRKQLSSSKRNIKHRGIISAVVMAKHLATTNKEPSEIGEESVISIASLPQGNTRDAACLLELSCTSCANCPELMGLYYDQLASMLMTTQYLDKYFMGWLYETITHNFQTIFITETLPESTMDLEFSMQYELNSKEDLSLGVNIGGLTVDPKNSHKNYILLLAPHFRLLRLLHYRQHDGDLSSIDALLGSAVILPKFQKLDDLEYDQLRHTANCIFHCVNWFREVISAFVTQDCTSVRLKVIKRLRNLIEVEDLLYYSMQRLTDHRLPVCYFDSLSQVTKQNLSLKEGKSAKNPRKKLKTNNDVNETTIASTPGTSAVKTKASKKQMKNITVQHSIVFREVDTDLVKLLKYPLDITDSSESQSTTLNIHQLKFILKDFVMKMGVLTKGKEKGLSHLNVVTPISIITDCVCILPKLDMHLQVIIKEVVKLLDKTDWRHDLPPLYTKEALELRTCFGLIVEIFYYTFSWSGFQNSKNFDLLRKILKSLLTGQSQNLNSANRLIMDLIKKLSGYIDKCLDITHGMYLLQTMESLYATTVTSPDIQKIIVSTSSRLLGVRWYSSKSSLHIGKTANFGIEIFIKVYLKNANLKTLSGIVGSLQEQCVLLRTKEDCLHMLASIDKHNFHLFYSGVCTALHNRVKSDVLSLTNDEHLVLWKTTAMTMQGLMSIAKTHESKTNLTSFLKKSIAILKIFLSHGIPILEIMLRHNPDDVLSIFKSIQTNTRFLHHLCCYSKVTKDTGIMSYVPQFRLTLETLIYRVKAALVANNCSAAFWMGNLRNRDLQGDDILTQSTVVSEENDKNDNEDQEMEELPEDESHSDASDDEPRSESEVFD